MKTRRIYLSAATLIAVAALLTYNLPLARVEEPKTQLMFVQSAEDLEADDKTLRLVNVGQPTLYFSDRPVRIAGQLTMPAYMDKWKASADSNNFSNDTPNATLSVYEPRGHPDRG